MRPAPRATAIEPDYRFCGISSRSSYEALDGLFDDIRTGRKRFVPYQSLKLYGSGATADEAPSA